MWKQEPVWGQASRPSSRAKLRSLSSETNRGFPLHSRCRRIQQVQKLDLLPRRKK